MQADLNNGVRNDPYAMDLQYPGMRGQAYGNGFYSGLSDHVTVRYNRENRTETLPGQFIKISLYGFEKENIVKVHRNRNTQRKERFFLEVLLTEDELDEDELVQDYVNHSNFSHIEYDDLEDDYIVVCTKDERDDAIKLHNKVIVKWKAKHLWKRYRNLFRLIGRFFLWYTEISLRPQHSGAMRAREEFYACTNMLH